MLKLLLKEKLRESIKLLKNYGLLYLGVLIAILIGFDFIKEVVLEGSFQYTSVILGYAKDYYMYIYGIVILSISYVYINSRFPLIKISGPTLFYFRGTKYMKVIIITKIFHALSIVISITLLISSSIIFIDGSVKNMVIFSLAAITTILSSSLLNLIKYNGNNIPLKLIAINLVIFIFYFINPKVFIILELANLIFLLYYNISKVKFNGNKYLNDMDNLYRFKIAMKNSDNAGMMVYANIMSEENESKLKLSLVDIILKDKYILLSKLIMTLVRAYLSQLILALITITIAIVLRLLNVNFSLIFMIFGVTNIINILIDSSTSIFINSKKGLVIPYSNKVIFKVQAIVPISILIIIALSQAILNNSIINVLFLGITYITTYCISVWASTYTTRYIKYAKLITMIFIIGVNILVI